MEFNIAGVRISFIFPDFIMEHSEEKSQPEEYLDNRFFRSSVSNEPELPGEVIHVISLSVLPEVGGKIIWQTDTCTVKKSADMIIRVYHDGFLKIPYAVFSFSEKKGCEVFCDTTWLMENLNKNYLFNICALEWIMMKNRRLVFHSCFVEYNRKAILFSGFSGIGKSTQGALWETYRNAAVVNGDRCVIGQEETIWTAYGFPFSGTSGICRNRTLPVRAIIFLSQAKENRIRRASPLRAGQLLWQQMMVNQWDSQFIDTVLNMINQMVEEIPVYELACTPDERAVECLEEMLKNDDIE